MHPLPVKSVRCAVYGVPSSVLVSARYWLCCTAPDALELLGASVCLKAVHAGVVETLLSVDTMTLPPGCGPCPGAHQGVPGEGDARISTANRNIEGRIGAGRFIYLTSPEIAAVTALAREIADPRGS